MLTTCYLKPIFHLANLFARTDKKVGTVPTCSRGIFSPANFNQSRLPDSCFRLASIEIIDIECVTPIFSQVKNLSPTKWRISKGIFSSSRLLREEISRGCEECGCFFVKQSLQKDIKLVTLNGKMVYKKF